MNQSNNSYFYEIKNRNDALWNQQNTLLPFEIVRQLNQDHHQNKIYSINGQDELIQKAHYHLKNQFLLSKNKHINLENLILKKTMKEHYYGLELSTNYETLYLYGCKDIIEEWYSYIKIYTIQNDFRMNYDFIKLTGKGAHAKVYKIFSKRDNQIYAVKVFKKKSISNKLGLFKEVQILRQLQHKNVIRLKEVYENAKHLYLILDYLPGGELLQAISSTEVYSETVVQELIQNLLNALDYIHQNKILHRDIKPQNLLLRSQNNITDLVIADFGLSDEYNTKGEYIFKKCGTIGYIAPEILRNEIYDYKVDIFSVGVIMFMLLTDSSPFVGKDTNEVIKNNFQCNVDFEQLKKAKISTHAYDFVKYLLEQNPNQRPTAQQALQHDWFYLPKMETLQYFSLSLKNIQSKFQNYQYHTQTQKKDLNCKISQFHNLLYGISFALRLLFQIVLNLKMLQNVQVFLMTFKIKYKRRKPKQGSIEDNLEEMNDEDFYKYRQINLFYYILNLQPVYYKFITQVLKEEDNDENIDNISQNYIETIIYIRTNQVLASKIINYLLYKILTMQQIQKLVTNQQENFESQLITKEFQIYFNNKTGKITKSDEHLYFQNKKGNILIKKHYYLKNQYLIMKNKFLNYENCQITFDDTKQNLNCDSLILLEKQGKQFIVYGKKESMLRWFEHLKRYTIQRNFKKQFKKCELLGRGSQAKVFKILNIKTGQTFATKQFDKNKMTESSLSHLLKEISILRQLNHDGITKLFEVFENKKKIYIIQQIQSFQQFILFDYYQFLTVLECLNGGELLDQIRSPTYKYNEQFVMDFASNLLKIIDYNQEKYFDYMFTKQESCIEI